MFVENTEYEILTPDGWRDFRGITQLKNKVTYKLTLENGGVINATPGHYFFNNNNKIKLSNLAIGDYVDTTNGSLQIISITMFKETDVYDIVEVAQPHHQYIVNSCIITKNCDEFSYVQPNIANEFWTSISPTLATGGRAIITSTPNSDEDQFALIWKESKDIFDEYGNERTDGIGRNGFYSFKSDWWEHPDRDENWKKEEIGRIGVERFRREFNCLAHHNGITVQDTDGNIFQITIGELYDSLQGY